MYIYDSISNLNVGCDLYKKSLNKKDARCCLSWGKQKWRLCTCFAICSSLFLFWSRTLLLILEIKCNCAVDNVLFNLLGYSEKVRHHRSNRGEFKIQITLCGGVNVFVL